MAEDVIVAIDGGPASNAAVDWMLDRARTATLSVELTTVVELDWAPAGGPEDDFHIVYERALSEAGRRVDEAAPTLRKTSVVRRGSPVEELIRASTRADLLVIGTNKRTGFLAGAVYGTLPLRLAAHARCPLVVVPANWTRSDGPVVAGAEDDRSSDVALDFAAREAARLGRGLVIVHAWTIPATLGLDDGSIVPFDALQEAHEEILALAAGRIRAAHPGLEVAPVLEQGPAAPTLVEASQMAALLVVGTHGRGAVAGLILGSVSHDVLLNMPCPIAVVPRPAPPPVTAM
ncbi:universal stress protein [Cryobacterium tagatosivorans]|uniref:Universal stress protein n=1 Tax=Cryobacterium tagatosivorans TaxID=1259199 RepID=A0A4R8UG40_9MICO|nr:universal stress protein [Cryobacterium tagatosivorans]TFB51340.1 universal stress protein [Cryobacterium tagatosivorans]